LFNGAGILKHGTSDLPAAEIDELLKINLNGAIYTASYVAAQMRKQRSGYIINVASIGGKIAQSFSGVYASSKFGIVGFSEALSKEMAEFDVKVTCLCPGQVATEMTRERDFSQDDMIQVGDINKTIGYLLSLSKNAIPFEITINCLPFVKKMAQVMHEVYGLKKKKIK
jgi:short-subunit dehydrogenase